MSALSRLEWGGKRLPFVFQAEAAECGLACLAMVAGYHGHRTDLGHLRARFSVSLRGVNLQHMVDMADALSLASRPVRLDIEEMPELKTPCILHWDLNHFVVLHKADARGIVIHDPAIGVRRLAYAEVSKHFTGVALELTPNDSFEAVDSRRKVTLRGLMGKTEGLGRALSLVLVMALALEAFALLAPMFNQWVVDEALVSSDRGLLNLLVIGFALMLVAQTAISLARGWTVMYLSTHVNLQWAANVFSHLLRLPVAWFERRHLGDVVSRFGSIASIQRTLTTGFVEGILDGLMALATGAMMLLYSPALSLVVFASVVLYALLRMVSYRPLREANVESLVLSATAQSCFLETLRGVQAIKLFGRELERRTRWLNLTVDSVNRDVRTQKFMLWFGIANTLVFGLEKLLVFWFGAHMVMDGSFTVGMLFAFASYQGQFTARLGSLIDKGMELRMLSLHGERLADIVLEPPEQDEARVSRGAELTPRIELVDVGFRYSEMQPWVLRHLNLAVEPGESLALVGASGCGKTTLVKLVLGLLPPTEGEIRYGGVPIDQLGQRAYRELLAVVMQDDHLLSGSLADNIAFFDPKPDATRIEMCARMAAVHDDIAAMPMAYHTLTGDMGTTLSGGQKQRVLLARALYKSPKVLVLDEATSHLDVERERLVNDSIRSLQVTRICVAHRPETIAMADRVVVMAGGCIVQDLRQVRSEPPAARELEVA
ncbi:peptidase domain-containing ABC transporter [Piscinibacter terrae]|uniref:Cyclolysin secretion/processing ATP-binding protein CyaB n=1 Tax=Piscinibacter terrae TaxID=2496871 RepID=A0A3N7JRQ4_9BURK|nr:peptidase domain-containing ABC transporter [Albitalea terrae]RQP23679.1 peptidase domain-containing ABC transporter [Albitalea terrae]